MAECNWCDDSKWFFQLDKSGLCKECAPTVSADIGTLKTEVAGAGDPDPGADWQGQVAHYDAIRANLGKLLRYEGSGIPTIDPPPSAALVDCGEARAQVILAAAREAVERGLPGAQQAASDEQRTAIASDLLAEVKHFQELLGEPLPEFGENNATVLVRLEKQVAALLDEST